MASSPAYRLRETPRKSGRRPRSPLAALRRAGFCAVFLAIFLGLSGASAAGPQASPSVEYQVKAAFLLNFAKFVDWPSGAFQNDQAPIALCVFGHDPFAGALDEIIQGKKINNREILARRINGLQDLKSCQLVFIGSAEDKRLPEILNSLKGASVLVIGESDAFAERGGAIQFFVEDNRLRFAINVDAVQRSRLTVSSKLLALARIVHDPGHPKGG
jgi:hypothetical protein